MIKIASIAIRTAQGGCIVVGLFVENTIALKIQVRLRPLFARNLAMRTDQLQLVLPLTRADSSH